MRWDAGYIRYLIAIYPYLEAGRWPPSDRAADKRARGALKYGSCPPTSTVLDKAMLDQAIRQLEEPYRSVVQARIIGRSNGRAARLLGRRQDDVTREFDRALELLAELVAGPATATRLSESVAADDNSPSIRGDEAIHEQP